MSAITTEPPPQSSHRYGSSTHSSPSSSSRASTGASASASSPTLKRPRPSSQNAPSGASTTTPGGGGGDNSVSASPRVAALSTSAISKRNSREYGRLSGGGSGGGPSSTSSSPRVRSSPQMRRTTTPRHAPTQTPPQRPQQQQQQQSSSNTAIDGVDASLASAGLESPSKRPRSDAPKKILPREYYMCSMTDLVVLISDMLSELVSLNDDIPLTQEGLTRFHSRAPPTISIHDYLHRITLHTTLEASTILSMVYYIDLLSNHYPAFTISSLTVHRFLITAATVASKGLCDSFCTNNFYARVGGVSLRELNVLELEFLGRVKWRIVPPAKTLQEYYRSLVARMKNGWEIDVAAGRPIAPVGGLTTTEAAAVTGLSEHGEVEGSQQQHQQQGQMGPPPPGEGASSPRSVTVSSSLSNSSAAFSSSEDSRFSGEGEGDAMQEEEDRSENEPG